MDKPSFFRKIFALFFSVVILLSFLLGAYIFTFYDVIAREEKQEGLKQTEVHGLEIQKTLEQMDGSVRDLLLQQYTNLQLLKSPEEAGRFYASQSVFRSLRDMLANSKTRAECIVVADNAYAICLDYFANGLTYADREALRQFTQSYTYTLSGDQKWGHERLNGQEYVYRVYLFEGRAVAAYYRAAQLTSMIPVDERGQAFVLSDWDGAVLSAVGKNAPAPGETLDEGYNKSLISGLPLLDSAFFLLRAALLRLGAAPLQYDHPAADHPGDAGRQPAAGPLPAKADVRPDAQNFRRDGPHQAAGIRRAHH